MPSKNIAVVGAGVIGRTLGSAWRRAGHAVTFGSRDPGNPDLRDFASGIGAGTASLNEASTAADVVLLALPGAAMPGVIAGLGPVLAGKTVIDAANRLGGSGPMNSLADLAQHAPDARVYRAFNSLGWENFADADYGGVTGDMLYAGPAGSAQDVVAGLIGDTGLRPIWVGDHDKIGVVDDFARLWFTLAFDRGMGRNLGVKFLTRSATGVR